MPRSRPFKTLLKLATTGSEHVVLSRESRPHQEAYEELHEPRYAKHIGDFAKLLDSDDRDMRSYGLHFLCMHATKRETLDLILDAAGREENTITRSSMADSIKEMVESERFPLIMRRSQLKA